MYTISIEPSGLRWTCRPGESLCQGADKAQRGQALFHGCRGGGCGVCKVYVLSGQYQSRPQSSDALSPLQQADGMALACCVEPMSDMVIRLA